MRWFWVVTVSNAVENALVTDDENFGGSEDQFVVGTRFNGSAEPLCVTASRGTRHGTADDALQNHLALPILSPRAQRAFNAAGIRGAEFVPVRVCRDERNEIEGYGILNVLFCRSALDRTQSDFDVFPDDYVIPRRRGAIRAIRRPVLKRQALVDTDFVRLEGYPYQLFVSENVKRVFDDCGFTGWTFREVDTA